MADSKLSCFFLGLGVGTAVGLLFAPKPSGELVGDLRERASEGRNFLWLRSGELRHQAEEILERGRSSVAAQREQLAAALEAGRRAYQEAASEETEMGDSS